MTGKDTKINRKTEKNANGTTFRNASPAKISITKSKQQKTDGPTDRQAGIRRTDLQTNKQEETERQTRTRGATE